MQKRRLRSERFKAQAVLDVLTGVKSAAQGYRDHGIKASILSRWKQKIVEYAPE